MDFEIEISCCLCSRKHKTAIEMPEGWGARYDGTTVENGFCPEHELITKWADSQCPGCAGGWGDCSLWSAFAYQGRRNLDDSDFGQIESGICPKRTNGTFLFSIEEGFGSMDLSEKGGSVEGVAFAKAIREYWENYPENR